MRKLLAVFLFSLMVSAAGVAADQYADLKFTVVREVGGKPIPNASVILHSLNDEGRQQRNTGLQLKTDSDGEAELRGAPFGKVRIQVIARGFQTFGDDYEIDQSTEVIEIKMKRPGKQFSIYEEDNKKSGN